eukprot:1358884-Prorocentrum_lima.AAC.1
MSPREACAHPARDLLLRGGCAAAALCGCGADRDRLHRGASRWGGRAEGVRGEADRVLAVVALPLQ